MNNASSLTIGFIEKRPRSAGRALESMSPSDAANFLSTIPTRYAVSVLAEMNAWPVSAIVAEMEPTSVASVLSEMDYQSVASVVRLIPTKKRVALVESLPKKLQRDLNATLNYPADTVGAKMSVTIVAMSLDQTVQEALSQLRKIKRSKTGVVFVMDRSKKLLGIISADELLQHQDLTLLSDIMNTAIQPLAARTRLANVASLNDWDDYAQLPVVNRKKLLVGALAAKVARRWEPDRALVSAEADSSIVASILTAFTTSMVGLAVLATDFDHQAAGIDPERAPRKSGGTS